MILGEIDFFKVSGLWEFWLANTFLYQFTFFTHLNPAEKHELKAVRIYTSTVSLPVLLYAGIAVLYPLLTWARYESILFPHLRVIHQLSQSELGELEWGLLTTFHCAPVSSNYGNTKQ